MFFTDMHATFDNDGGNVEFLELADFDDTQASSNDDWQEAEASDPTNESEYASKFVGKLKTAKATKKTKTTSKKATIRMKKQKRLEEEEQGAKEEALIKEYYKMVCEICSYTFKTFLDVRHHYRRVHSRAGYLTCCNKRIFNRSTVLDHIKVHLDPDTFR